MVFKVGDKVYNNQKLKELKRNNDLNESDNKENGEIKKKKVVNAGSSDRNALTNASNLSFSSPQSASTINYQPGINSTQLSVNSTQFMALAQPSSNSNESISSAQPVSNHHQLNHSATSSFQPFSHYQNNTINTNSMLQTGYYFTQANNLVDLDEAESCNENEIYADENTGFAP